MSNMVFDCFTLHKQVDFQTVGGLAGILVAR